MNAPVPFMDLMNQVFKDNLYKFIIVFIDDIIVYLRLKEEHEEHLRVILQRLSDKKLYSKFKKSKFRQKRVYFLGHMVSKDWMLVDPLKIEAVSDWNRAKTVTEVRSFWV